MFRSSSSLSGKHCKGEFSENQTQNEVTNLQTAEKIFHSLPIQESLAVHRGLVRDIPHRRPGHFHHIVEHFAIESIIDKVQHRLRMINGLLSFRFKYSHEIAHRYSTQVTQKQLLVAIHLASQRVQKINCNSLDKALLGITDAMQKDSHKALIFKKLE